MTEPASSPSSRGSLRKTLRSSSAETRPGGRGSAWSREPQRWKPGGHGQAGLSPFPHQRHTRTSTARTLAVGQLLTTPVFGLFSFADTEDASETDLAKHDDDDYVEIKEQ